MRSQVLHRAAQGPLSYDKVAAKLRVGVGTWGAGGSNMRGAGEARPAEASSLCAQNLAAA